MDEVEKALWGLRIRAEEIWQANQRRINNKSDEEKKDENAFYYQAPGRP